MASGNDRHGQGKIRVAWEGGQEHLSRTAAKTKGGAKSRLEYPFLRT